MKLTCKKCHFWRRGHERHIVSNGETLTRENDMGTCYVEPQTVETHENRIACRHYREYGT